MNCPKCGNTSTVKNGFMTGKQRYLCKPCNYNYTNISLERGYPSYMRKQALELYLEGLGFRSIGRLLKVSEVTILNWIRRFGEEIKNIHNESQVEIMELDELHTYIKSKKTLAGSGLLLIDLGTNTSNLYLETDQLKQVKNYGRK